MKTLIQDLRFGLRTLAKSPGFTAVAVLTLALGIGANTAIFSLIDAVMLRSLPARDPSQLVLLRWSVREGPRGSIEMSSFGDCPEGSMGKSPSGCTFPYPVFEQIATEKEYFSEASAFAGPAQLVLAGHGAARMASGELVSGNYFSTLGVNALAGRTLGREDDSLSAVPAVVLSYRFWQSEFGGDRSAVGRSISLNGVPFTIVGVADPSFTSLSPGKSQDLFLAIAMVPRLNIDWGNNSRGPNNWWLVIMARLKPGISLERAQAATTLLFRNEMLHGEKPLSKESDDPRILLAPAQQGLAGERGEFSKPLYVLMFAVGVILLIACANVAGLLLSRAAARQKEMAVRLALGAGGGRIVRQLLTESVTLSLAGGALGILFAYWGVRATEAMLLRRSENPFPFVVEPDWRVLAFTISVSVFTGIFFGLAPAYRAVRLSLAPALKENAATLPGGGAHPGRGFHLGKALVVVQVALSTMVLIGAGLFVRTLQNLHDVDPGFDTRNILIFGIDPTLLKYQDLQIRNLYRSLQEQLAAIPGVISVSYSSSALLSGGLWTSSFHLEGETGKVTHETDMLASGPDFFKTIRIPLLAGRTFNSADFEQAAHAAAAEQPAENAPSPAPGPPAKSSPVSGPPVPVVINAAFVHQYFSGQNPLGKLLVKGGSEGSSGDVAVPMPKKSTPWEIVGVVGDAKYNNLRREIHPTIYLPAAGGGAYFELRTATDPSAIIPAVRDAVKRTDSNLPIFQVRTQTERIEELLTQEHAIARLASFFGALALLLACVGLYGLLSYEVSRRIILRGINLTLVGVVVGVAGGLALTRLLSSLLFGVKPTDPLTFVAAAAILAAVALVASYIPARRATKVDPMVALRYE
ncbi:MAG: hypothetical protein DMG21_13670 [Acidobacteria bacterium]|nr:MAG: hypothetical protein DMG21_13670 [Acidobacteriota bacterium]